MKKSSTEDLPSFYERLVEYPAQRVLFLMKMSPKEILDFYKYVSNKANEDTLYLTTALDLEEEPIVQHYLSGTLTEEMLVVKPAPELTPKEEQAINETVQILEERQKERRSLVYRLYRKICPKDKKRHR